MAEEKEIINYYTNDGNIYCIECINKNRKLFEKKALFEREMVRGVGREMKRIEK